MRTADRRTERCGERGGSGRSSTRCPPTDRPTDRPGGGRAISPLRRNEWPAGGCSSMMVEAGGFHILLPLHQSCFPLSHLLIYSKQSRLLLHLQDGIASLEPVHLRMEGRGKEGQDPKTGLKMEEKKRNCKHYGPIPTTSPSTKLSLYLPPPSYFKNSFPLPTSLHIF